MYEEYFGLRRPPFKITPDTSLFFGGGKRGDILEALVYAIDRGEGIIKVVGEVGSGKTMLCRMLQLKLPESVETIYIGNPSVTPEDILFVIANELNLHAAKDASKHQVMHLLQEYLLQRHMESRQVVLFIEEAQGMPIDTLEEIRLLSNLETDQNKLLQIILFGQPELDENLAIKSIRQLRERITHSFNLSPLTRDEIHEYLNFRMREVGYSGPELINPDVAKKIEQYSNGLLRRINIIADKVLLSAYSESTHNLKSKHVTAAANDSSFNTLQHKKSKLLWWLALLALLALAFASFNNHRLFVPDMVQSIFKEAVSGTILTIQQTAKIEKSQGVETLAVDNIASYPVIELGTVSQEISTEDLEHQIIVATVAAEKAIDAPLFAIKEVDTKIVVTNTVADVIDKDDTIVERQKPVTEIIENDAVGVANSPVANLTQDYRQWLDSKIRRSREWLSKADGDKVLMRRKSGAKELAYYLQNDWPLDLDKTYLYEVKLDAQRIYRVFYHVFDSVSQGQLEMKRLPNSVKSNSPYLNSVYRMQKALL